jgi:hypothetical protein
MMELFDLGNQDILQQAVVQRVIIPCSLVLQARWIYVLKRDFSMQLYGRRILAALYYTA